MKPRRIWIERHDPCLAIRPISDFPHDPLDHRWVRKLRKTYRIDRLIRDHRTEFEQALALAEWVCLRWKHRGVPSPLKKYDALSVLTAAEKGHSFSCVQFASVFTQCCHAVGIPARSIQITTARPDLGDSGQAHWTNEYWDNELRKWVWIDANVHVYARARGVPLSFLEYLQSTARPRHSQVTLESLGRSLREVRGLDRGFFRNYNSTLSYGMTRESSEFFTPQRPSRTCLLLAKARPFATFQGFALHSQTYVSETEFYSPVNQTQVLLETFPPRRNYRFKGFEDYRTNHIHQFALPKVKVALRNNMPWFAKYEVEIQGVKKAASASELMLKLKNGKTHLRIRAVNKYGRKGPITEVVIRYDSKYPGVKSYW